MKISNKVLIPAVFLSGALCMAGAYFMPFSHRGNLRVTVYRDGSPAQSVYLDEVTEPRVINLGTNRVCVTAGGSYMESASCKDRLCVKQGKIDKAGQSIVCLPNRIEVRIEGAKSEVDAVAGAR